MRPTLVRWTGVLVVLVIVLALALGLALASGPSAIALSQVLAALSGGEVEPATADIVLRVRLPRAALAMGVGASLSVSGVLFQALLRNPLADPYVPVGQRWAVLWC